MPLLREWVRITLRMIGAVLVLGALYLAVAWWTGQHLPASASVDGIQLGGLAPQQARDRLHRELGPRLAAPLRVDVADTASSFVLEPGRAGLSVDLDDAVAGLTGFTVDPSTVWARLTGRVQRTAPIRVDRARLGAALAEAARTVDRAPIDAAVRLDGGRPGVTQPRAGLRLSVEELAATISARWPEDTTFSAPVRRLAPRVDQRALDAVLRDDVIPALAGPVTVVVGGRTTSLAPEQFASALVVAAVPSGVLVMRVDPDGLADVLARAGVPIPPVDGLPADRRRTAESFQAALGHPTRTLTVPVPVPVPAPVPLPAPVAVPAPAPSPSASGAPRPTARP